MYILYFLFTLLNLFIFFYSLRTIKYYCDSSKWSSVPVICVNNNDDQKIIISSIYDVFFLLLFRFGDVCAILLAMVMVVMIYSPNIIRHNLSLQLPFFRRVVPCRIWKFKVFFVLSILFCTQSKCHLLLLHFLSLLLLLSSLNDDQKLSFLFVDCIYIWNDSRLTIITFRHFSFFLYFIQNGINWSDLWFDFVLSVPINRYDMIDHLCVRI